jgi:adenosylhomocysteine nucleosidase
MTSPADSADRRIVVVAAFAAEVADVPDGIEVVLTGLGKSAAAAATTERLLTGGDRDRIEVWNVGTAGALRDGLAGVFTPGSVLNHDLNGDAIRALGLDPLDHLTVDGGDGTVLASGDVFVADPVVRDRLAERAHLVDMEGYGIAFACSRLGVPVRFVKHVSDNADEAAVEWADAVAHSSAALGAWLATHLPG